MAPILSDFWFLPLKALIDYNDKFSFNLKFQSLVTKPLQKGRRVMHQVTTRDNE